MTTSELHTQLLRPAVLQILRAAGFSYTRPIVLDAITDLAARYLLLLASSAARNAFNNHNTHTPTIQDVRLALLEAGGLRPQLSVMEEHFKGTDLVQGELLPFEDMRGVDAFISWAEGPVNKEIRRIAGYLLSDVDVAAAAVPGLDDHEDYVTALKKKHNKTDEDARYQGSVLGKDAEPQTVMIVGGGPATSLAEWQTQRMSSARATDPFAAETATPVSAGDSSAISSAPLTPMSVQSPGVG